MTYRNKRPQTLPRKFIQDFPTPPKSDPLQSSGSASSAPSQRAPSSAQGGLLQPSALHPLLSIILITKDNAARLPRLLNAIFEQLPHQSELIVVERASQDRTWQVLQSYQQKEPRLQLIQLEKDKGSGAARNAGLKASRGRYLAFQDDSDLPHPTRFSRQLSLLEHDPQIDLVFSSLAWVDQEQSIHQVTPSLVENGGFPPHPERVFQLLYLNGNQLPTTTLMFRRELLESYGYYPERPLAAKNGCSC